MTNSNVVGCDDAKRQYHISIIQNRNQHHVLLLSDAFNLDF